jgi:uncharacterized C2H2 Zn-finger protein
MVVFVLANDEQGSTPKARRSLMDFIRKLFGRTKIINLHGFDIETDLTCKRCGKAILSRNRWLKQLNICGLTEDESTHNIDVINLAYGDGLRELRELAQELEQLSALKCNRCGKIYCLACLFQDAPRHPTSGGKACFSCLGSISHA